jgi:hypothetical protein
MAGFLSKTKIDTSLENIFRDHYLFYVHTSLVTLTSNGVKLKFSVTIVSTMIVVHQVFNVNSRGS